MVRWILPLFMVAVVASPPAWAQAGTEVAQGSSFRVQNGTECVPNSDVQVALTTLDGVVRELGATIADGAGHFEFEAAIPGSAPLGRGEITATCGLDGQLLVFDLEIVAATDAGLSRYVPHALVGLGVVVVVGLLVARRNRADSDEADDDGSGTKPAGPSLAELADASADADDDPDYWFWDTVTERGNVKRLACLSNNGFYLHEVPVTDFTQLLEQLAELGPDAALAGSFFHVPVAAIDEIHRRGSQLRVVHHRDGERAARVIDLGSEVDGVVDLLSRRVQVLTEPAASNT